MKNKETPEEAYDRIFDGKLDKVLKAGFTACAKWQEEQNKKMYSIEDMKLAFETGRNFQLTGENNFKELIK